MAILAFSNHKGGVGKTTTTANVGAALAKQGYKVLLVDLDAQQNLTSCFINPEGVTVNVADALVGKIDYLPIVSVPMGQQGLPGIRLNTPTPPASIDLVPSSLALAPAETQMLNLMAREKILTRLLAPVKAQYDFILLDCPPSLGAITVNALTAADAVYIPLIAEVLPYRGLEMLTDIIDTVRQQTNPLLTIGGVILTRYNNRSLNDSVERAIRNEYGEAVCATRIRENIAIAEAQGAIKSIFDYSPDSNGAKDFAALADEIARRTFTEVGKHFVAANDNGGIIIGRFLGEPNADTWNFEGYQVNANNNDIKRHQPNDDAIPLTDQERNRYESTGAFHFDSIERGFEIYADTYNAVESLYRQAYDRLKDKYALTYNYIADLAEDEANGIKDLAAAAKETAKQWKS